MARRTVAMMPRPLKHSERRAVDRLLVGVYYRQCCRAGVAYGECVRLATFRRSRLSGDQ